MCAHKTKTSFITLLFALWILFRIPFDVHIPISSFFEVAYASSDTHTELHSLSCSKAPVTPWGGAASVPILCSVGEGWENFQFVEHLSCLFTRQSHWVGLKPEVTVLDLPRELRRQCWVSAIGVYSSGLPRFPVCRWCLIPLHSGTAYLSACFVAFQKYMSSIFFHLK